jgi:hypothetical protein
MTLCRKRARLLLAAAATLLLTLLPSATTSAATLPNGLTAFCSRVAQTNVPPYPPEAIFASSGAMMACFGPQPNRGGVPLSTPTGSTATSTSSTASGSTTTGSTKNVDAADPQEDVSQNGTRAYGQSEESVAASGPYVVEAWNDSTFFFQPCPDPTGHFKEEATGLGFSSDGGKTFADLGGLPNDDCANARYYGDPSVEAYQAGGNTYFYISSLYLNFTTGESDIAMDACQASGATLTCNTTPTKVASGEPFCVFLDIEFASIDQERGFY